MKTKSRERILLHEDSKKIEAATKSAKLRAEKLNDIAKVFEFESEEEFNQRTENIDRLVKGAILAIPELKALSKTVLFESIRVPDQILEARRKLEAIIQTHDDLFVNISHDGHQFIEDVDKLEAFAESQRLYATGPKQIEVYNVTVTWCNLLNKFGFGFDHWNRGNFDSVLIDWNLSKNSWVPNYKFISSL